MNGKGQWSTRIHNLTRSAQKIFLLRLLFRNTHAFDMEPFTAFSASYPRNSAAGFTTSLSGAELIDSSPGHFFRATDLWPQALHTTSDTRLILRGETEQPKTRRKGTNKRKPGWGFLKASKVESLRLHKVNTSDRNEQI